METHLCITHDITVAFYSQYHFEGFPLLCATCPPPQICYEAHLGHSVSCGLTYLTGLLWMLNRKAKSMHVILRSLEERWGKTVRERYNTSTRAQWNTSPLSGQLSDYCKIIAIFTAKNNRRPPIHSNLLQLAKSKEFVQNMCSWIFVFREVLQLTELVYLKSINAFSKILFETETWSNIAFHFNFHFTHVFNIFFNISNFYLILIWRFVSGTELVFGLITTSVDLHLILTSFFLSSLFLINSCSQMNLSQVWL